MIPDVAENNISSTTTIRQTTYSSNNREVRADKGQQGQVTPSLRLCRLRRWPTVTGYGFTMHLERERLGQYIGKVLPGSPAEAGGLREEDRILEVNGENVEGAPHHVVAEKVRARFGYVDLLVVDVDADRYYQGTCGNLPVDQRDVITMECPKYG